MKSGYSHQINFVLLHVLLTFMVCITQWSFIAHTNKWFFSILFFVLFLMLTAFFMPVCIQHIQQATHLTNFLYEKNFFFSLFFAFCFHEFIVDLERRRGWSEFVCGIESRKKVVIWKALYNEKKAHIQVSSHINHLAWIGNDKNLLRFVFLDNWIAIEEWDEFAADDVCEIKLCTYYVWRKLQVLKENNLGILIDLLLWLNAFNFFYKIALKFFSPRLFCSISMFWTF